MSNPPTLTIRADKWRELSEQYARVSSQLADAKAENERVSSLNKALEGLLACYRIGKRPSGKLLDEITRLKDAAPKEATDETPTA